LQVINATDDTHFIAHGAQYIVTAQQAEKIAEGPEEGFDFTCLHADQFLQPSLHMQKYPRDGTDKLKLRIA